MRKSTLWGTVAVVALAGAGAWWWGLEGRTPGAAASAPGAAASAPPVNVTTIVAERRDWPVSLSASGTVSALNTVEVRAQVCSTVT
jgi:multidrug efflux pump subunit AcrA (membrane-fusion protein)